MAGEICTNCDDWECDWIARLPSNGVVRGDMVLFEASERLTRNSVWTNLKSGTRSQLLTGNWRYETSPRSLGYNRKGMAGAVTLDRILLFSSSTTVRPCLMPVRHVRQTLKHLG